MGKKKKSKKSYYSNGYGYVSGGNKKASKKAMKKAARKNKGYTHDEPRLNNVKLSLNKKDAKENKRIIMTPVEVEKAFNKNRSKCNHAGDIITPAQFRALTPNYAAYTPWLERVVAEYSEDNVRVCKACYDVIADAAMISSGDIESALVTLYVAANAVVSHRRMKPDEIKSIYKMRQSLADWHLIVNLFDDLAKKGAFTGEGTSGAPSPSDINKLNQQDGSMPIVT